MSRFPAVHCQYTGKVIVSCELSIIDSALSDSWYHQLFRTSDQILTAGDLKLVVLRVHIIFRDLADKSQIKRVRPKHEGPLGVNRDVTGWILENSLNLVECICITWIGFSSVFPLWYKFNGHQKIAHALSFQCSWRRCLVWLPLKIYLIAGSIDTADNHHSITS